LIDYLMVSALFLLVVGLSLPTIMQLAALLRADVTTSRRPLPAIRVPAGSAGRAVV
jgi:hypothetical protein